MKNLVLLMAVLVSGVAMAQETVVERKDDGWVVVKDGNGTLRTVYSPTPQMALEAIRTDDQNTGKFDAAMILKQKVETRSDAELDAFADELVRLVMETPSRSVANKVLWALGGYKRGLDILIDIYENLNGTEAASELPMLSKIFRMPDGGKDYVMNLYASLKRPEEPCKVRPHYYMMKDGKRIGPPPPPKEEQCPYETQWCRVAKFLVHKELADPAYVYPICDGRMRYFRGEWALIR